MTKILQVENLTKDELYQFFEKILHDKFKEFSNLSDVNEKLSIKEVALELGVAELTIHNYIKKGKIRALKIGRRIFITRRDLDNALNEVKSIKYKR